MNVKCAPNPLNGWGFHLASCCCCCYNPFCCKLDNRFHNFHYFYYTHDSFGVVTLPPFPLFTNGSGLASCVFLSSRFSQNLRFLRQFQNSGFPCMMVVCSRRCHRSPAEQTAPAMKDSISTIEIHMYPDSYRRAAILPQTHICIWYVPAILRSTQYKHIPCGIHIYIYSVCAGTVDCG